MTVYLFENFAESTLSANIGAGDSSFDVDDGSVFPNPSDGEGFYLYIEEGSNSEWMLCTARSSNTLTVTRSGSPSAFSQGTTIALLMKSDILESFEQKGNKREVDADPNGSAAEYAYEEVYDSVNGIWYKHCEGTTWVALNS